MSSVCVWWGRRGRTRASPNGPSLYRPTLPLPPPFHSTNSLLNTNQQPTPGAGRFVGAGLGGLPGYGAAPGAASAARPGAPPLGGGGLAPGAARGVPPGPPGGLGPPGTRPGDRLGGLPGRPGALAGAPGGARPGAPAPPLGARPTHPGGYNPSGDLLAMISKAAAAGGGGGLGGLHRPGGGPGDRPAFDASDFPALGGGPAPPPPPRGPGGTAPGGTAGDGFSLASEREFPALGGGGPAPSSGDAPDFRPRPGGYGGGDATGIAALGGGSADAARVHALRAAQALPGGGPGGPPQQQQQQQPAPTPAPAAGDRYGLLGLLGVIRMADADLTTLALGTDLTTLGLALGSPDPLHTTFASPWADAPCRPDPEWRSPACYLHTPPRLAPGHFARFALETLFFAFYAMPGDEAQVFAADELARRGWTFHKEYRVWVARVPGAEPAAKTPTGERGSFLVFDTGAWETVRKDGFVLHYDALERPPNLPRGGSGSGGGGPPPGAGAPPQAGGGGPPGSGAPLPPPSA